MDFLAFPSVNAFLNFASFEIQMYPSKYRILDKICERNFKNCKFLNFYINIFSRLEQNLFMEPVFTFL